MKRQYTPKKNSKQPMKKARKEFKPPNINAYTPTKQVSERKAVDTNFNLIFGNEDSMSNKIILINDMNQGVEAYERIGRSIRNRMISVKGVVYLDGSLPPTDVLTITIFYSITGSSIPGYTTLYDGYDYTGTPTGTTSYRPFQMRNLNASDRYKVLWQKTIRVTDQDEISNSTETNNMLYEAHIPCDFITKFDNTPVSGRSGSVLSGGIFLIVQGLSQPIASCTLATQGTARCTYEDS